MKDKFCEPLKQKNGPTLYGGAARNKRLAEAGGLENLIRVTVEFAFQQCSKADLHPDQSNVVYITDHPRKRA